MRRTLLSLSIAAAISLPVLVQASVLSDKDGNQTVSGDQTYTQVQATNGNTLTFTNGSINVDNYSQCPRSTCLRRQYDQFRFDRI